MKHGLWGTRLYLRWKGMISRCYNPNRKDFHCYGGRGIKVCKGLRLSPLLLLRLVGHPAPGMTLDRIRNDSHYSCGECEECISQGWQFNIRWATRLAQTRNFRRNHIVTIGNQSKPLSEMAELHGVNYSTLRWRAASGKTGRALINL